MLYIDPVPIHRHLSLLYVSVAIFHFMDVNLFFPVRHLQQQGLFIFLEFFTAPGYTERAQ